MENEIDEKDVKEEILNYYKENGIEIDEDGNMKVSPVFDLDYMLKNIQNIDKCNTVLALITFDQNESIFNIKSDKISNRVTKQSIFLCLNVKDDTFIENSFPENFRLSNSFTQTFLPGLTHLTVNSFEP